jgi:hypothetical protein
MHTIYTFGYQGSTIDQLQAYQQDLGAVVVDIRYVPWSRDKQWTKDRLDDDLQGNYVWARDLGNINYRNGGPIQLANPANSVPHIRARLNRHNIILLCACWNVETCHRKVAAEYLAGELGAPVVHLPAKVPGSLAENQLKCLTLTPPWSTLVMTAAKRIETRSWKTDYRGLLGIHAAKGFPKDARALCSSEPFKRTLYAAGYFGPDDLPTAALLGTVQLVDCGPVESVRGMLSADERAFGDYSDGRYAWLFDDPQPYPAPMPMKGALGLWTATLPVLEAAHE